MKYLIAVLFSVWLLSFPAGSEEISNSKPTSDLPPPANPPGVAALAAEFYATLSAEQKAKAEAQEEVQLFGAQLSEVQRKIALEWLRQSQKFHRLPEKVRAAVEAGKLEIIEGVGIIGAPPSLRIWTSAGFYFDRINPVSPDPSSLPVLMRRELLLKRKLFSSLSAEQNLKARPEGDGGKQGLFADTGGLRFGDLNPAQQSFLQELAAISREQSAFMHRDARPGKPETFRVFYWEDAKYSIPGGQISFGSFGKEEIGLEIGGRKASQARAEELQKAKALLESLTAEQRQKAQSGGVKFSELSADQQAFFTTVGEMDLLLWGGHRNLPQATKADWQLDYNPRLTFPGEKISKPALKLRLAEYENTIPADGKPFLQETLMLGKGDYLPLEAEKQIGEDFPEWSLIDNLEFEPGLVEMVYFDFGQEAGPQWMKGDFDGDGQADYAVLLRKDDKLMLLALRELRGGRWQTYELTQIPAGGAEELKSFITRATPGEIAYYPPEGTDKTGRLQLRQPGVILHFSGQTSSLFYWQKKAFAKVQTGD